MLIYIEVCNHCGREYDFQASGNGCFREGNNKDYCPRCYTAIQLTLKDIPIEFKYDWVNSKDFTREEAIKLLEQQKKEADDKFEQEQKEAERIRKECPDCPHAQNSKWAIPGCRRVFPCLFDWEGSDQNHVEQLIHNNEKYLISYWEQDKKDYSIRKWERVKTKWYKNLLKN